MAKKCAVCSEKIEEEHGKLKGTAVKVKDENGKNNFVYACSSCQKKENWIEEVKVKSV